MHILNSLSLSLSLSPLQALKKLTKKASGGRLGGSGASSSKLEREQLPPPGRLVPVTVVQHKGVAIKGTTLKEGQVGCKG